MTPTPRWPLAVRFYFFLTRLCAPLLRWIASRQHARMGAEPDRFRERLGGGAAPGGPVLWIVAASLGELRAALAIVGGVAARRGDATILVTTTTATAARVAAMSLPRGAVHRYQPLDTPQVVQDFITAWRPRALLVMESEVDVKTRMDASLQVRVDPGELQQVPRSRRSKVRPVCRFLQLCLARAITMRWRFPAIR